ncbi:hypothetical protein N9089_03545 [Crocinitomicaceae bacterium]|nr:hypothetical protein [Crocinitomicaceae bacterium]
MGWPDFIATGDMVDSIKASGTRTFKDPTNRKVIDAFRKFCPSATQKQHNTGQSRNRGLVLPNLEQARAEFAEYIGGEVQW